MDFILVGSQQNLVSRDFPSGQWLKDSVLPQQGTPGLIPGGGIKMLHGSTKKKIVLKKYFYSIKDAKIVDE